MGMMKKLAVFLLTLLIAVPSLADTYTAKKNEFNLWTGPNRFIHRLETNRLTWFGVPAATEPLSAPGETKVIFDSTTNQLVKSVNGGAWESLSSGGTGSGDVTSVFGRTGAIIAQLADYDSFFLTQSEGDSRYLQTAPVDSVFGRTGIVSALQSDYDAFFTTPSEAASAAPVQSVFGRTGTVSALQADYDAFFTTTVEAAAAAPVQSIVEGTNITITESPAGTFTFDVPSDEVTSVFGRTGIVSALQADYDSFFLTPAEGDARYLQTAPVDSVFGRTGTVSALQSDYDAFFTTTAEASAAAPVQSVAAGTNISIGDDLAGNLTINSTYAAPVDSVFGRTGIVSALQADYDAFFTTTAEAAAAAPVQTVFGRSGTVSALQADYDSFFLTPAEGDAAYARLGVTNTFTGQQNISDGTYTWQLTPGVGGSFSFDRLGSGYPDLLIGTDSSLAWGDGSAISSSSNVALLDAANTFTDNQTVSKTGVGTTFSLVSDIAGTVGTYYQNATKYWSTGILSDGTFRIRNLSDGNYPAIFYAPSGNATFLGSVAWGGGSAITSSSNVALLDASNTFTSAQTIATSVNAAPATSGTAQPGKVLRFESAGATSLDFGINATLGEVWLQGVDKTNLANTRVVQINPNGGNVEIGKGGSDFGLLVGGANTAASPLLQINGDTNTGIWHPAADTLSITAGGVQSARFGTTFFEVGTGLLYFYDRSIPNYRTGTFRAIAYVFNDASGVTKFIIDPTNTPASPLLQLNGDINTGLFLPAADTLAFSTGGTEAMRIDSSGVVETKSGRRHKLVTKTANYTATTSDHVIIANGGITITLPTPSAGIAGQELMFRWNGTSTAPFYSGHVDGNSGQISTFSKIIFVCDGTTWWIMSSS